MARAHLDCHLGYSYNLGFRALALDAMLQLMLVLVPVLVAATGGRSIGDGSGRRVMIVRAALCWRQGRGTLGDHEHQQNNPKSRP